MLREWEWSWEGKDNKCRFGFAVRQILWVYCYITQRRHWGNNSNLTSVPWVSFAPPFLVQTGTDKKLRGSAAARGHSSPESVALVRAGPAPLFPTQLHKSPQKMFLNPPPPPQVTSRIQLSPKPFSFTDCAGAKAVPTGWHLWCAAPGAGIPELAPARAVAPRAFGTSET